MSGSLRGARRHGPGGGALRLVTAVCWEGAAARRRRRVCGSSRTLSGPPLHDHAAMAGCRAPFRRSGELNTRLGAHLPLAHTQCDYAAMLLTRGRAGDQKRATALLHSSNDTARRLGLKAVADRVETMLLRLHPKTALPAPARRADLARTRGAASDGDRPQQRRHRPGAGRSASTPWRRMCATSSPRPAAPTVPRPPPTHAARNPSVSGI